MILLPGAFSPVPVDQVAVSVTTVEFERRWNWTLTDGYAWSEIETVRRTDDRFALTWDATLLGTDRIAAPPGSRFEWRGGWRRPGSLGIETAVNAALDDSERSGPDGTRSVRIAAGEGKALVGSIERRDGRIVAVDLRGDRIPVPGGTETAALRFTQRGRSAVR